MGYDDNQLGNIEEQIAKSSKKIEDLANLIKELTDNIQDDGGEQNHQDILNRLEAKIEGISQLDAAKYYETVAIELKRNIDERQKFINSKILSIEDLIIQVGEHLNEKIAEIGDNSEYLQKIENIQKEILFFSKELSSLKDEFLSFDDKVRELLKQENKLDRISDLVELITPFLEKLNNNFTNEIKFLNEKFVELTNLIEKLGPSEHIEKLQTDLDAMGITVNAVLSAIQMVEFKYKDIQDSFSKIARTKDIHTVQTDIIAVMDKIALLNDLIKLVSTKEDIDALKEELRYVSHSLDDFKEDISVSQAKGEATLVSSVEKLESRFENILMLLADGKAASGDINDRINEISAKFDSFQEVLLKLLAMDNVDIVKKDIREIFVKVGEITESLKQTATMETVADIKQELNSSSEKISQLNNYIENSVLQGINNISSNFSEFNKKIDSIHDLASSQEKIEDLKKYVIDVTESLSNISESLKHLSVLSDIEHIKEKVDKFPENDQIYTVKDDLNYLVGKVSTENDAIRGELYSLQQKLNQLSETLPQISFKECFDKLFENLEANEQRVKEEVNSVGAKILESNSSRAQDLEKINNEIADLKQKILDEYRTSKDQIIDRLANIDLNDGLEALLEQLRKNEQRLSREINNLGDSIYELGANKSNLDPIDLNELIASIKEELQNEANNTREQIISRIQETSSVEHLPAIIEKIDENQQSIIGCLEKIENLISDNKAPDNSEQFEAINNSIQKLQESIDQLLQAQDAESDAESSSYKEEFRNFLVEYKNNLQQISAGSAGYDLNTLKEELSNLEQNFVLHLVQFFENVSFTEEAEDIKCFIEESDEVIRNGLNSINENIALIKENTENLATKDQNELILADLDVLKSTIEIILSQDNENSSVVLNSVHSVLDSLEQLNKQFNQATSTSVLVAGSFDNINKKLDALSDTNETVVNAVNYISEKLERLEELKTVIKSFENFSNTQDLLDQISVDINILKEKAAQLSNNGLSTADDLLGNYESADKADIETIRQSIANSLNELNDKLDNLEQDGSLANAKLDEITEVQRITLDNIEDLGDKLLKAVDKDEKFDEIVELQKATLDSFEGIGDKIESLNDAQEAVLDQISSKIENLIKVEPLIESLENFADSQVDLRDGIYNVNENISNILEELKLLNSAAQDENEDEVLYQMEDVQSDFAKMRLVLSEISKALEISPESGDSAITRNIYDLSEKINGLSANIERVSGILEENSHYNSSSIDSNFHNLRVEFKNIVDLFEKLNEDVSDISARTNKLILTSEDNNKELKTNLADFRRVINQIGESTDNTKIYDSISSISFSINDSIVTFDRKIGELRAELNRLGRISNSSLQSTQIIKQAFMQFAHWIDGASEVLEELSANVSEIKSNSDSAVAEKLETIDNKATSLSEEVKNITEYINKLEERYKTIGPQVADESLSSQFESDLSFTKYSIRHELNKIEERFAAYEAKLNIIEQKLDNLSVAQKSGGVDEIRPILEFIASQASAANENSRINAELLGRIEKLEMNMNSFDSNVKKLVEFIDEE